MKGKQRTKTFGICDVFPRPELVIVSSTLGKGGAAGAAGALLFASFGKNGDFHKARRNSTCDYVFLQSQFCLLRGEYLPASEMSGAFSPFSID